MMSSLAITINSHYYAISHCHWLLLLDYYVYYAITTAITAITPCHFIIIGIASHYADYCFISLSLITNISHCHCHFLITLVIDYADGYAIISLRWPLLLLRHCYYCYAIAITLLHIVGLLLLLIINIIAMILLMLHTLVIATWYWLKVAGIIIIIGYHFIIIIEY